VTPAGADRRIVGNEMGYGNPGKTNYRFSTVPTAPTTNIEKFTIGRLHKIFDTLNQRD
jgi:hypothetical protein